MKTIVAIVFLFLPLFFWAQKPQTPTERIRIVGDIVKEDTIGLADLRHFAAKPIDDLVITNNKGEQKSLAKGMEGVLLREVLSKVEFKAETPTKYSEFYLVAIASDGYTVVYSWNELFNSPTGDHTFLLTLKDGKPISAQDDRILLLTTTDFKTGRRYVKNLQEIKIIRVR